jgi:hypothetical protein
MTHNNNASNKDKHTTHSAIQLGFNDDKYDNDFESTTLITTS